MFSDPPAVDSGVMMTQIFVGKTTLVADVYPLKSTKQFVRSNTLVDNIPFGGAMSRLISDYAQVEISSKVKDILRMHHSLAGILNLTTRTRTWLRGDTIPSKAEQTLS